ncbi:MAG: hypothetical protein D6737_00030 [Chloroflexi bacterium]|nr:MAG: hypothetical protein D6737_00030 [Chloroflexota bacterium]
MDFDHYQQQAKSTAQYPREQGRSYTVLGLAGEAGELANLHKKLLRGDYHSDSKDEAAYIELVRGELGDVLWYAAMVAEEHGLSLAEIAQENLDKLASRQARGVIKGSGDKR